MTTKSQYKKTWQVLRACNGDIARLPVGEVSRDALGAAIESLAWRDKPPIYWENRILQKLEAKRRGPAFAMAA
jgi:hypothetical protein